MTLFLLVVLAAIAFEYINGFHDAANAIATVVSARVLTPRQAIAMAAFFINRRALFLARSSETWRGGFWGSRRARVTR